METIQGATDKVKRAQAIRLLRQFHIEHPTEDDNRWAMRQLARFYCRKAFSAALYNQPQTLPSTPLGRRQEALLMPTSANETQRSRKSNRLDIGRKYLRGRDTDLDNLLNRLKNFWQKKRPGKLAGCHRQVPRLSWRRSCSDQPLNSSFFVSRNPEIWLRTGKLRAYPGPNASQFVFHQ